MSGRRGDLVDRYGPWAVVTGASSGIGRATAARLAAGGSSVVLVARGEAGLRAVADELAPARTRVLVADLGSSDGVAAVAEGTADLDVGVLVSAAGFGTSGDFLAGDPGPELDMLAVNCAATYLLARSFGARFAARGAGGIVLFGSIVGRQGTPTAAHYAATKAYVHVLGEGLHLELAGAGVDVLVSAPGPVRTGFADRAGMRMASAMDPDAVAAASLAALGRRPVVTPGGLSKLLTWSLALLPRSGRSRVMGRVMAGMAGGARPPAA